MLHKTLILIAALLGIKFFLNLFYLMQCKRLLDEYKKWVSEDNWDMVEKKHQVVELLRGAGLEDLRVPRLQPMGYGQLASFEKSVFTAFPSNEADLIFSTIKSFHEAIGIYKNRMWNAINPVYWLKTFIFLPKKTFPYLGIKSEGLLLRFLQIVWWIFNAILVISSSLFPQELDAFIKTLFQ